jgi:hypothetical protein
MKSPTATILFVLTAVGLAGCGNESPCADTEVLKTVKKLFDHQQFGEFTQVPPNAFVVQAKSATPASTDKQNGKSRCSVLIVADILEIGRFTGQTSEADIAKIKEEATKRGMALTKEYLVNYIVQPMASGQNYVTVLP